MRDSVIQLLRKLGMTTVFGNPGSTELPFYTNWPADFRYILGLQESVAVAMADGYAQATRNAAFVNLHSAAGVGHALGSIFTAYKNRTPLVITAGQQARSLLMTDPFLHAQYPTEFPKPYVKWSTEPARGRDVPAAIARAYFTAMQQPSGPTFVSIPSDDWEQPSEFVATRQVSFRVRSEPDLLGVVADALNGSRRPGLVVGPAVDRDKAWDLTVHLAERLEAPVWASPKSSRCSFPENHRLFAGFLPAERSRIASSLSKYDVVLVLGAPAFSYHIETDGPSLPPDTRLFQIVDDPELASWAPLGTAIVSSLDLAISDLLDQVRIAERDAPLARSISPAIQLPNEITVDFLMTTLAEVRPEGSIVAEEAPSSRGSMQKYLPILHSDGFFATASGGLGFGLPAAVGLALARPRQRVIALVGDGSSMYSIQALWSAAANDLSMTFVVIRNGTYAALADFAGRMSNASPVGIDLPDIDFVSLARGHNCDGVRVERPQELKGVLEHALQSTRTTVVEVVVGNQRS